MTAASSATADRPPHIQIADPAGLERSAEADAWNGFARAATTDAFCQGWLAVTCVKVAATEGVLVLAQPNGRDFRPAAVWPQGARDRARLGQAIEQAVRTRALVVLPAGAAPARLVVAQPLQSEAGVLGAVAIEVERQAQPQLVRLARELAWGAGWIEAMVRRRRNAADAEAARRLRQVLDVFSAALEHDGFAPAATATVTELATLLHCDRVCLGIRQGRRVRVKALSHAAQFEPNSEPIRAIEAAMEEAVDQRAHLV